MMSMGTSPQTDLSVLDNIPHLGLMAFQGRFPILVAQAAAERGIPVTAFGVKGITPPELADEVIRMHWMELGQFSRFVDQMHAENIRHVVMAGRVPHNAIWHYRGFDLRSLKVLGKLINRKADTVLGAVVAELAKERIEVIDSTLLLRGCMPEKGLLTPKRPLTERETRDVEFGLPIARQIAGMDIGQTIVVKDLAVVAVESLEGTDETILRGGKIAGGDIVVIKVSKPRQDARFDYPVIGPDTIRTIQAAGGGALAVMAGHALFFDRTEALEIAAQADIGVIAI
jgi:UDP-2,3-diacylglucosamine hydrolase